MSYSFCCSIYILTVSQGNLAVGTFEIFLECQNCQEKQFPLSSILDRICLTVYSQGLFPWWFRHFSCGFSTKVIRDSGSDWVLGIWSTELGFWVSMMSRLVIDVIFLSSCNQSQGLVLRS